MLDILVRLHHITCSVGWNSLEVDHKEPVTFPGTRFSLHCMTDVVGTVVWIVRSTTHQARVLAIERLLHSLRKVSACPPRMQDLVKS